MEILKKKNIFDGHYRLNLVDLLTASGEQIEREQFETPDSVSVLVHQTEQDLIILVEQFRLGPEKPLLEIVAGKFEDKDLGIEETAKREVLEEVGYKVEALQKLHSFFPTPGPVTEEMTLFYARVNKQVESGGGLASENEEIKVVKMSAEAFKEYEFHDAKTLIAQKWFQKNL